MYCEKGNAPAVYERDEAITKGCTIMSTGSDLSEAQRAVIERYLRGDLAVGAMATQSSQHERKRPVPAPPSTQSRVPLIAIQPTGPKRPLFYVHVHWIGGASYSFAMAQALGSDQPLFVMDPYRFEGLPMPPSIEAMATAYIDVMRGVQPDGPYRLGSFCGGSLIAYEMAQQLLRAGQGVEVLLMIDPLAGPLRSLRLIGAAIRYMGAVLHLGPQQQVDWFLRCRYISRILRRAQDENSPHVELLLRRWREEHMRRFSAIPAAGALRQDWMAVFAWTVAAYVPRPYPGRITYLLAQDNPTNRRLWWGSPLDNDRATIHLIPGTHTTCRAAHLPDLAAQVRTCLSDVS